MSRGAIHQFVAGFRRGDAISQAAVVMRRRFRAWGRDAEIVCEARRTDPQERHEIRDLADIVPGLAPGDVVILHLSIGTPVNLVFAGLKCRKVVLYHNVTPAHYFRFCNPALAADLELGRRQAETLAGTAAVNLADSVFNASELTAMGYRDVRVLPLMIDVDAYTPGQADAAMRRRLSDGALNILFVGRSVPNKHIEDLLSVVHLLQGGSAPNARLVHVGSRAGLEAYHTLLMARVRALGLRDTRFLGTVTPAELNACYATAHAFLCLSRHEGFCAPLIEAMLHDVPVFALNAAAVPETLAGAGVLFGQPDFPLIAETIGRVLDDPALRRSIVNRQQVRLASFRQRDLDRELREALAPVLDGT